VSSDGVAGFTSDEDLRKSAVGQLRPHNAPIELADYDPGWPQLFAREAARIRSVLGDRARWRHVQHYAEAKAAGVQEIMARADAAAG
jgi:GrpB-like predicted nucleotidyltransferase (UPF0157 family)